MADFTLGLGSSKINEAISNLFQRAAVKNLFSGSQTKTLEGIKMTGTWSAKTAPVVELRDPSTEEWDSSIKANGTNSLRFSNAFITNFSKFYFAIEFAGIKKESTFPVKTICSARVRNGRASLSADSIVVDTSQMEEADRGFAKVVLVPEILHTVTDMLSGIDIPTPSFAGVRLTPPTVGINENKLIVAFNLTRDGQPRIGGGYPAEDFFVLLSKDLMQVAINDVVTEKLQGKTYRKSGRESGGGFTASYNTKARLNRIDVRTTNNPVQLRANANLSMQASAGIDFNPADFIKDVGDVIEDVGKKLDPTSW